MSEFLPVQELLDPAISGLNLLSPGNRSLSADHSLCQSIFDRGLSFSGIRFFLLQNRNETKSGCGGYHYGTSNANPHISQPIMF
jgi:hypothetical protein